MSSVAVQETQNPIRKLSAPAVAAKWQSVTLCAFSALFIYFQLFRWPLVPVWRGSDQGIFLLHAERMLSGQVLYRDLFQFNLPGTEWFYYLLFRCFGASLAVVQLVLLIVGVCTVLLLFSLSRMVLKGWLALAPPLLFLFFWCPYINGSHHWYSTVLLVAAVRLIVISRSWPRLLLAGLLVGAVGVFTSSRGAFAILGISIFLLWLFPDSRRRVRSVCVLLASYSAVTGGVLLVCVAQAGIKSVFESVFVFPSLYYRAYPEANGFQAYILEIKVALSSPTHPRVLLMAIFDLAVPLLMILFLVTLLTRGRNMRESASGQTVMLYSFVASACLLAVATSPNFNRFTGAAGLVFVLAVWQFRDFACRTVMHQRVSRVSFSVLCVLLTVVEVALAWSHPGAIVQSSKGTLFAPSEIAADVLWVAQHSRPGDCYFGDPGMDFVFGLKNPTALPWVTQNGYTRPEQVQMVLSGLEKERARFVESIDDLGPSAPDDNLPPLRAYLHQHYIPVHEFNDGSALLERIR